MFIKIPKWALTKEVENDMFLYTLIETYLSMDRRCNVRVLKDELLDNLNIKDKRTKKTISENIDNNIKILARDKVFINVKEYENAFTGNLNMNFDKDKDGKDINWFPLDIPSYQKILDIKTKENKMTLLKIYAYICSRINRRSQNKSFDTIEVFWGSQRDISENLEISRNTLDKYISKLCSMDLIYQGCIGKVTKDGKTKKANNVYALREKELEDGLIQSKSYWEKEGWRIINKK